MRNPFSAIAAAAVALGMFMGGCAKETAPPPPEPAKMDPAGKGAKAVPKAGVKWFTGTIETMDTTAGTFTLRGPKGAMEFKADENAKKDFNGLKTGEKVIVKHTGRIAHSIVTPGGHDNTRAGQE